MTRIAACLACLIAALLLTGPDARAQSAGAVGPTMTVTPDVNEAIDLYLENATLTSRYWALAISNDGTRAERVGCPKSGFSGLVACYTGGGATTQVNANRLALKNCGADCFLLYVGQEKVAEVTVIFE